MNIHKMYSTGFIFMAAFIALCTMSASGQIVSGAAAMESALGGSPLVINEFMAANTKTIADPQGEYDDWIELFNSGSNDIDLSSYFLSDKADNPKKWQFPANTIIKAGGYLIVWADENGKATPGLHANFKLSASGEMVLLSNGSSIIDSISFGPQSDDISFGRYPNGTGAFKSMNPTPAAFNDNTLSVESEFNYTEINKIENIHPNPIATGQPAEFNLIIARPGRFAVEIRDITGRVVSQVLNAYLPDGTHKLIWDGLADSGSMVTPGVYFLVLKSGADAQSKPALLVVE